MGYLAIIPLAAWLMLVFVWSFVFGRYNHGSDNRIFLTLAGSGCMWLSLELLFYLPTFHGYEMVILRAVMPFWIPIGFLFLAFAYSLVGRRIDWIWVLSLVITIAGVLIDLFTDLILKGFTREAWGVADSRDVVNHTFLCLVPVLSSLWGLLLVFRQRQKVGDDEVRKPLTLILVGGLITLTGVMALSIVIPNFLGWDQVPRFGASAMAVFVFVVFLAVLRHDFLTLTVERVADDLFNDVRDGIALVGPDDRVRRMNRAAREMTGASVADSEGKGAVEVLPGFDAVRGGYTEIEVAVKGLRRVLTVSTSTLVKAEHVIGKVVFYRDITEQRLAKEVLERSRDQLEEDVRRRTLELKRAQKMEAMGALAGGIAHDFNNLLAAIMGFATAARDDLEPAHAARNDFDEVIKATQQARDIVRQLLNFSRQKSPTRKVVEVGTVLTDVASLLETSLPATIGLHVDRWDTPCPVMAHPTEIHQVMMNLGTNAYQAIYPGRGDIWLAWSVVDLEEGQVDSQPPPSPGRYVKIEIRDNGHGVRSDLLEKIFEPFFTTQKKGRGTGLGLATVRRIVADYGGAVSAESEEGRGTTFQVYFPYHSDAGVAEEERT